MTPPSTKHFQDEPAYITLSGCLFGKRRLYSSGIGARAGLVKGGSGGGWGWVGVGGLALVLFQFNFFFKFYHFYILKLLYPLQNCAMYLKKNYFFLPP